MPSFDLEMLWDCPFCDVKAMDGTIDNCPKCGAAHDEKKSPWYLPSDTSYANRITDPEKQRKSDAGANWHCPRCEGTQRNGDGNCLNCSAPRDESAYDGGSANESEDESTDDSEEGAVPAYSRSRNGRTHALPEIVDDPAPAPFNGTGPFLKMVAAFAAMILLCSGSAWALFHKSEVNVQVASVHWLQSVSIERYQQVGQEGFAENEPSDAANIVEDGSKVHHYVKVLDHYDTVHYTERVADGQSCHTTPTTCTSRKNGTARCSGGDRECSTKYKSVDKTRQEAAYRKDPVYAMSYRWTVWRWTPNRTIPHIGDTTETTWPSSEELCVSCALSAGEKERESGRTGTYDVTFVDTDKATYDYVPKTEAEFHTFPVGTKRHALYSVAGGLDLQTTVGVK